MATHRHVVGMVAVVVLLIVLPLSLWCLKGTQAPYPKWVGVAARHSLSHSCCTCYFLYPGGGAI